MSEPDPLVRARGLGSVDEAVALYREWADRYDDDVFEELGVTGSARIADLLADHLDDLATPVVDLGCGTGAVGCRLAERGLHHVTGLDLSPEMLAIARHKDVYEDLVVADLTDPRSVEPYAGAFGASVSAGTFTHGHVGADSIQHLLTVLRPGSAIAWVVANALWPHFRTALEAGGVTVESCELEPIRRDTDDRARMVVAHLP